MTKNLILEELRITREQLLENAGGTVSGLLLKLRAEQAASDRPTFKTVITPTIHRSESEELPGNGESSSVTQN